MGHCIGTYCDKVHQGHSFIYRVFVPERATLEVQVQHGRPTMQLKLAHNKTPSQETFQQVTDWLQRQVMPSTITV